MTQNRLKRATQREHWWSVSSGGSPTGGMGTPTGLVKAGMQGS